MNFTYKKDSHIINIAEAFIVVVIWATSWIIIKNNLSDVPPLFFAGSRYFLASIFLLLWCISTGKIREVKTIQKKTWPYLILLGIAMYATAQGAQYIALSHLPSNHVSLFLNFSPVFISLLGILILGEKLTILKGGGILIYISGISLYFLPIASAGGKMTGYIAASVCFISHIIASLTGRYLNKSKKASPMVLTAVTMFIGGTLLFTTGIIIEGFTWFTLSGLISLLILVIINTCLTFPLWNKTLRYLSASESSMINSTLLIFVAILAWYFLDEVPTIKETAGIALSVSGVILVQKRVKKQDKK
jgi:drug/metabolite transporter (DMT)-like permease